MAADASAAQRAYDEIKRLILDGALPVRSRLDLEDLARRVGVSSMPVRLALNLLNAERLVRPGEHSGYEVALWPAAELAQLYEWRGALLTLVLPSTASAPELQRLARTQPYAQAVETVMRMLEGGANPNLRRSALNADERLRAARVAEARHSWRCSGRVRSAGDRDCPEDEAREHSDEVISTTPHSRRRGHTRAHRPEGAPAERCAAVNAYLIFMLISSVIVARPRILLLGE